MPPPNPTRRGYGKAGCPTIYWHQLALVGIGLVCRRLSVSLLLTQSSMGHLLLKRMPSALQGVSAWHLSSWLRYYPTASSVMGRILEVLRYVPIPVAHARIRSPRQPNAFEACFTCILDPDSFSTAGLGRCVTHWTRHTYNLPCHQPDVSWRPQVSFRSLKGET